MIDNLIQFCIEHIMMIYKFSYELFMLFLGIFTVVRKNKVASNDEMSKLNGEKSTDNE